MAARIKTYGPRSYLCIVENFREGKKVKQRTIASLGRYQDLHQSGKLDALTKSLAKFSKNTAVLSPFKENSALSCWSKEWGSFLVFRRLWENLGLVKIIKRI